MGDALSVPFIVSCLYGIQGIALDWFRSYLTNRTQRCLVNAPLPRICSLNCGIPQGTIFRDASCIINVIDIGNLLNHVQNIRERDCSFFPI